MINPITEDEVLYGFEDPYYCCMIGATKRSYSSGMWPAIFRETGGIGFLAREELVKGLSTMQEPT